MKNANDFIYKNKNTLIKNTISLTIIILVFAIYGCFSFVDLTFHFENLFNVSIWLEVATKVLLLVLIRSACLLTFMDIARKTNADLIHQKTLNEKLLLLRGNDFAYYCESVLNVKLKKDAFKEKIKHKITKLERRARAKDKALYYSNKEIDIPLKETNKFCIKMKQYDLMLTDEYLEKNYNHLDVKFYPRVDASVFDIPIVVKKINRYQLSSHSKSSIGINIFNAVLGLIGTQTIWIVSDLTFDENITALAIFINILMNFTFIIWQVLSGIITAFSTVNNQEVLPYANRNIIIKEYIIWREPTKADNLTRWIDQLDNSSKVEKKTE